MEAWGRRKRSIGASEGSKRSAAAARQRANGRQLANDMTLSREIVVLDLKEKEPTTGGDEEGLASPGSLSGGAQKSHLRAHPAAGSSSPRAGPEWEQSEQSEQLEQAASGASESQNLHCLSSQSVLALICSIGLLFILYVCAVALFFARRDPKISVIKHQYH